MIVNDDFVLILSDGICYVAFVSWMAEQNTHKKGKIPNQTRFAHSLWQIMPKHFASKHISVLIFSIWWFPFGHYFYRVSYTHQPFADSHLTVFDKCYCVRDHRVVHTLPTMEIKSNHFHNNNNNKMKNNCCVACWRKKKKKIRLKPHTNRRFHSDDYLHNNKKKEQINTESFAGRLFCEVRSFCFICHECIEIILQAKILHQSIVCVISKVFVFVWHVISNCRQKFTKYFDVS